MQVVVRFCVIWAVLHSKSNKKWLASREALTTSKAKSLPQDEPEMAAGSRWGTFAFFGAWNQTKWMVVETCYNMLKLNFKQHLKTDHLSKALLLNGICPKSNGKNETGFMHFLRKHHLRQEGVVLEGLQKGLESKEPWPSYANDPLRCRQMSITWFRKAPHKTVKALLLGAFADLHRNGMIVFAKLRRVHGPSAEDPVLSFWFSSKRLRGVRTMVL